MFGISLHGLSQNPNAFDDERGIPIIIHKAVEFLKIGSTFVAFSLHSKTWRFTPCLLFLFSSSPFHFVSARLTEEGIFRLGGSLERINELKDLFNNGKNPDFEKTEDPNVVTGLFKQYLGSLPEPLLLAHNYETLIAASRGFFLLSFFLLSFSLWWCSIYTISLFL